MIQKSGTRCVQFRILTIIDRKGNVIDVTLERFIIQRIGAVLRHYYDADNDGK